jgi:hypothetical protein
LSAAPVDIGNTEHHPGAPLEERTEQEPRAERASSDGPGGERPQGRPSIGQFSPVHIPRKPYIGDQQVAADRNRLRKHVERACIVLASADRHSPQRVAHSIGVSRPTVWRWQQRFAESGVEGLLRDKTRKPGKPPISGLPRRTVGSSETMRCNHGIVAISNF